MSEIKKMFDDLNSAFEEFKQRNDERIDKLDMDVQQRGLGANTQPRRNDDVLNSALLPFLRSGDDRQIKNTMSVDSGPDGGYSVIPAMDDIIREVGREISPVYNLARRETCNTSEFEILVNTDLAGVSWVGETESREASATPGMKKVIIPVHEQACLQEVTQKLVDDSAFNVTNFVQQNVGTSFSVAAGTAFITGNGVGRPYGILSYDTSTADDDSRDWEAIQYVTTGASGDFVAAGNGPGDVFFDAMYSMKAPYLAGAVWLMSRSTAAEVRKLKDSQDRYYWQDGLQAEQPNTLIGFPVYLCEDMPAIAADSYSIAFGNLQAGYCIPERPGIRFLRDPYTNKPYVRLYFTRRLGGSVTDFNAIKLIRFSA